MKSKKLLSFILAAVTAISLLPTFTITASAATVATEKNITLGTAALSGYDSTNGYKYVYYGVYQQNEYTPNMVIENPQEDTVYTDSDAGKTEFIYRSEKYYKYEPIKWRILSMNGNGGTYYESTPYTPTQAPTDPEGGEVYTDSDETTKFIYLAKSGEYYKQTTSNPMFLLSEYALKQMAYESVRDYDDGDGQTNPSDWRYSDAWNWCNDTTDTTSFISSSFTDSERAYLLKTSKENTRSPYTDELKGDTFFFLSYAEASQLNDRVAKMMSNPSGNAAGWWLRSPDSDFNVKFVDKRGSISYDIVWIAGQAARPAFNLNLSSVLFTSAANGGKSSTAAGGGGAEISKNADYTISGDEKYEYKLTMKDSTRTFAVTEKTASGTKGETITFNYDNAETGSNEYISAMIVDETDGEVLYYGQGEKSVASANNDGTVNGTVKFTLPDTIENGQYALNVFNEQINGNDKTDFSSRFVTVALNVKGIPTASDFTFTPPGNLTCDGNAKAATVTSDKSGMGTITVKYYDESGSLLPEAPKNTGTYTVKIDAAEGTDYAAAQELTDSGWTFTILPQASVSSGKSRTVRYTVRFNTDGGSSVALQNIKRNTAAIEPTAPTKDGYIFDGWYSDSGLTTKYDFDTKVTKNITLYAKWIEGEIQEPSDDKKDDNTDDEQTPSTSEWKNPFADIKENDWYFDDVKYASENGLMSGITNTEFAPNESLTRAMLVTILWRAEGEPTVDFAMPFTDVIDTAYYAEAVRWAASEGIAGGVAETEFAPDENITREQIAVILYRYAQYKGYDVTQGGMQIREFEDFESISDYAIHAMTWAVNTDLMKGKTENTLNPKDFATRAEIAAILQRFIEANK